MSSLSLLDVVPSFNINLINTLYPIIDVTIIYDAIKFVLSSKIGTTGITLKNIIIKYYPAGGNDYLLNAVLFDIFSCEQDLASHCRVEDYLFVPAVLRLEKEVK